VKNRRTIVVSKRRLRQPKAYHFIDYNWPTGFLVGTEFRNIWATVGSDTRPEPYLPTPPTMMFMGSVAATTIADLKTAIGLAGGENGILGDRIWYYKSLDLRFNCQKNATVTNIPTVFYRVLVITERSENQNLDEFNATYDNGLNVPILFKDWKVRFDKVYAVNTGFNSNAAAGGNIIQGHYSTGRNFRFKIPFKYRASLPVDYEQDPVDRWQPPLNTFILIMCNVANVLTVSEIYCRQSWTIKP